MNKDFLDFLQDRGIEVKYDEDTLEVYSTDESRKDFHKPMFVVFPKSENEVKTTVEGAVKYNVPITPRGRGTGLTGGSIPLYNSVVVSMEKMDKIIDIDDKNMIVITQPGIITYNLQTELKNNGLFYPVDPASLESCSIGGNVATGAGGPRAVKYGTVERYLRGLNAVLPDGSLLESGWKLTKNSTGYNLHSLFLRSEGTLGIITKIYLSLLPYPQRVVNLLVPFKTVKEAVDAVVYIKKRGYDPSALELMEKSVLDIVEKHLGEGVPFPDSGAHLLIEFDGNDMDLLEKTYMEVGEALMEMGAEDVLVADNDQTRDRMWKTRRSIHEAVKTQSPIMEREDVVVPPAMLPELIEARDRLEEKHRIKILAFGHAGDGNVHINMIPFDDNVKYFEKHIDDLLKDLFKVVIDMGGQLSGEHGIGYFKKEYMPMALKENNINLMKRLKKMIDKNNIMNPGKVV